MIIAILIICIAILLLVFVGLGATYNLITDLEKEMKSYYDQETMRILTAMFNKRRYEEALERGEEVEI